MKYQYKFLSIVLAVGMLTACSSDEPGKLSQPAPASFSARIGNAVSRAVGAEWTAGDAIGISGVTGAKVYSNVEYTTASGDGIFTPADNGIFYQTTDPVTFTAYYPYSTELDTDDGIITVSTADQSTQASYDFLWAQATGSYEYPEVMFNFAHCMAQLNISFSNGNDVDLSGLTFTIDGLIADGTFDTVTGDVAATGSEATITAPLTAEHKSSLIVFPQVAERLIIKAQADGYEYRCYLYLGRLNSGSSYNVNITVSKTEMTVTDCTITPWGDGGNNEAELDPIIYIGDKKPEQAATGDFYMSDGSLVDKDATLTAEQKAACIGIVFTTDPDRIGDGAKAALAAKGIAPHGLVLALTNATSGEPCWSNRIINEPALSETDNTQKMYQNVDGYAEYQAIINAAGSTLETDYPAFYFVSRYGMPGTDSEKYTAPAKSTGWFMPSIGQWWDIMRNLGKIEALDSYKDNSSSAYVYLRNQGSKARGNINSCLSKIPGAGSIGREDYFWTSSEFDENNACGVIFVSDGAFYLMKNYKTMLVYFVRGVLAF